MNLFFHLISVIFKTVLSLIISVTILIKIIEQDLWVKNLIERSIEKSLIESLNYLDSNEFRCYCNIKSINILLGKLVIDRFNIQSTDWSVKGKGLEIIFFAKNFSSSGYFDSEALCSKVKVFSKFKESSLSIIKPIEAIVSQPATLPIRVTNIGAKSIIFNIQDTYNNRLDLDLSTSLSFYDSCLISTVAINDGVAFIKDKKIATKINGSGRAIIPLNQVEQWSYKLFVGSKLFDKDYKFVCSYHHKLGGLKFYDADQKIYGDFEFNKHNMTGNLNVYGNKLLLNSFYNTNFVNLRINSEEPKMFDLIAEYNQLNILKAKIKFNNHNIKSRISLFNDLNSKTASIKYNIDFNHAKNYKILGKVSTDFNQLSLNGKINQSYYSLNFDIENLVLKQGELYEKSKKYIIAKNNIIVVDLLLLQKLAHILGYNIQGNGRLVLALDLKNLKIKLFVNNGFLKVGAGINFIKDISCLIKIDFIDHLFVNIKNLDINFYEGELTSRNIAFILNIYSRKLMWAYIPIVFDKLFINWQQMLLGICMGSINITYKNYEQENCFIGGQLYLAQSKFKANILTDKLISDSPGNKNIFSGFNDKSIDFNIDLKTKNPIDIDTELVKAEAIVGVKVRGSYSNPELSGGVDVLMGTLNFPHKPLYIKNGLISIVNNNFQDLAINLNARNNIKDYDITMTIMGTVNNPEIKFSSCPNLTDEQILALLLSGSQNTPLMFIMPNLFMQNLDSLVLGVNLLKNIFKPLKYIRVAPDKVEVEITDKLRAKIKNNVNLSEEMQYELEYGVSDDIKVKAIKDSWGGVGPEIEMRWKF